MAVLDSCKTSYRNSVRIISAVVEALDLDINDYNINSTSFYNHRSKIREERAKKIMELFDGMDIKNAIFHWDGKIMVNKTTGKKELVTS